MDGRGRKLDLERDHLIALAVMENIKRGIRASATAKRFGIRGDETVYRILRRSGMLEAYRKEAKHQRD